MNGHPNDLSSLINSVVSLLPGGACANEHKLDSALTRLISESAVLNATIRLDPCKAELIRFINLSAELLGDSGVRPIIRSKMLLALSNLALFNIPLRKSAANNVRVCQAVYSCLQLAIDEQLGPQNKIDVLRLIQMLTYEKIELTDWVNKLLPFLASEILSASPSELLPYCMCILCNLVSQSKNFTDNLKQMDFYKCLCARFLQLLSHNSKATVISALVLIGYLDTATRDTVYSSQNLSQTFLCIFNVLTTTSPDILMTTHIAVDLLKKLIICQPKTLSDPPTLNQTARNLTSYSFFEKSIQRLTSLLNVLDPRSEESKKINNLLLSFCQIDELRSPVCMAITALEPTESKLTTPIHALLRIARLSFDEAIFPEVPLTALQLLTINIREAVNAGRSVRRLFSPINPLFLLVRETLDEPRIQTNSPLAPFQAIKIAEGLRLAEALSNDEEIRFDLLSLVSAQQCSAIFEQQLNSNPVAYTILPLNSVPTHQILQHYEDEPSTSTKAANLPLWSINAVSIPIQLMRLLASLKDYSKPHKELYWRSLKDARLLPFIAYAIARGDHELVYDAFVLLTHCAQVHEFPLRMLSNLTLKCASLRKARIKDRKNREGSKNKSDSFSSPDASYEMPAAMQSVNGLEKEGERIEGLTQLIGSLQAKLAAKQEREQELEKMLLQQQGTRANIQHFVGDLQKCVAESEAKEAELSLEKAELLNKVDQLQKSQEVEAIRLEVMEKEKKAVEDENENERQLHSILRGKFDEMTQRFDTAAKAAFEKQVELEKLAKSHQTQSDHLAEVERGLEEKSRQLEEAKIIVVSQESKLNAQAVEIAHLQTQNQQLAELREAMEKLLGKFPGGRNGGADY